MEKKYAVSACLLGIPCRWNGKTKLNKKALQLFLKDGAVVVCPEMLAGLGMPRPACEIQGGDGHDVLAGRAKVVDERGKNYTAQYLKGARRALKLMKQMGVNEVMLKSGSPSCGAGHIYRGDFSGRYKRGQGVFAALLKEAGIKIKEID